MTMKHIVGFLISILVGGLGAVAIFFASPQTREAITTLPWWTGPVAGLVLGLVMAGVVLWWHHRKRIEVKR